VRDGAFLGLEGVMRSVESVEMKIAASVGPTDADVRDPAFRIGVVTTSRDYGVASVERIGHDREIYSTGKAPGNI
jgi:hypothetical protein